MTNSDPFAQTADIRSNVNDVKQIGYAIVTDVQPNNNLTVTLQFLGDDSSENNSTRAPVVQPSSGSAVLPNEGDLAIYAATANGAPVVLGTVSDEAADIPEYTTDKTQIDGLEQSFGPETIDEYAAYWNEADVLIAADDAKSRSLILSSQIFDRDDITALKAANILANDAFGSRLFAQNTTISQLYDTSGDSKLSNQKGFDIATQGALPWEKLAETLYGVDDSSQDLLTSTQAVTIVEDTSLLSDGDMAKALTPFTHPNIDYNDLPSIARLDEISTDVDDARNQTLFQTRELQIVDSGNSFYDNESGQLWGTYLTSYAPAKAAADINLNLYPNQRYDWMMDFADNGTANGYFTYDELASIYDNSNLAVATAVNKFGSGSSSSDDARARVFGSANFSVSRAASFWNEAVGPGEFPVADTWVQIESLGFDMKLASSIDDANLTESNAEAIWNSAPFNDTEAANVTEHLTDVEKPLTFAEKWYHVVKTSPNTEPSHIGGDANSVWHADFGADSGDVLYELDSSDFSNVIQQKSVSNPGGVGGDSNVIWFCTSVSGTDEVQERDPSDLSVVRTAASPDDVSVGMGGTQNTIWYAGSDTETLFELSTSDFSVVQSAASPGNFPRDIGGGDNRVWHTDRGEKEFYEIDSADLSVVRSGSWSDNKIGAGGSDSIIYACDNSLDEIQRVTDDT